MEEIQMALPFLASASIMEEAITKIIRAGTEHFTPREWQDLVISARLAPAETDIAQQKSEEQLQQPQQNQSDQIPISLASPEPQHREIAEPRPVLSDNDGSTATFWSNPV